LFFFIFLVYSSLLLYTPAAVYCPIVSTCSVCTVPRSFYVCLLVTRSP
jgi:hypothetical protein